MCASCCSYSQTIDVRIDGTDVTKDWAANTVRAKQMGRDAAAKINAIVFNDKS
jgi:hypothetical protein